MDGCRETHTHDDEEPKGYNAWFYWAGRMHQTHSQKRCPHCGLYKVWEIRVHGPARPRRK